MAQRTTGMPMANRWSTVGLNPPCNNNHKKLLYCAGCKYTDVFHVKTVGAFSAKHTRGFTVQIKHGLIHTVVLRKFLVSVTLLPANVHFVLHILADLLYKLITD